MAPPDTSAGMGDQSPLPSIVAAVLGLALVGYAGTGLLDRPDLRLPILAAVAVLAIPGTALRLWAHRRARPVRDLTAALAPRFSWDSPKGKVKIKKRSGGRPVLVRIEYPATFADNDPAARAAVRKIVATRLGADVKATWDGRRRRLDCALVATPEAGLIVESDTPSSVNRDDTPEQARLRDRTTHVVQAIMGASANVTDVAFDGDTPSRIEVKYPTTTRDLSANYRNRVTMQIESKLPGEWRDVWNFQEDRAVFELRPPFPTNVRYPLMHKMQPFTLPFALDENKEIVSWKLGSKNPHALIVGPTGSGKTVLIRNLVVAARVLKIPVVLCDPKMTEYLDFEDLDGVTVLTDPEHIAAAIARTHDEMMRRYFDIRSRKARKGDFGKILFILDEFYVFKEAIADVWAAMKAADKDLKGREHPCLSLWRRMAVLARTAQIHLVLGIQRPDAEFLTGLARDSFRFRVSLDKTTSELARMMWGDARVGADLPNIQGRAIATGELGPQYVQVLRLLTPEDGTDFDAEDSRIWSQLVARMTHDAETYANGTDPLEFLGHLRTVESYGSRPELDRAPLPSLQEAIEQANTSSSTPADEGDEEEVDVYQLDVDDCVRLPDQDDFVTVLDLHFGADEDDEDGVGDEWIEISYRTEAGDEAAETVSADAVLTRRVPVAA
ncbi:FtsK/SpoIIIE domain-containing protein [Streptomyces sp. NEAU-S7GS2]|uniref:FtsK/SpoIIIE domain-containing protein n=1 Tax=Streptomyces sp. NEAU-S7GS2 TaxID=2202000 RepID=UPI0013A55B12|nr:FtsK/SpoIIIE domain-containing protein [Streptomyces sp. NEAU-S7GS2]